MGALAQESHVWASIATGNGFLSPAFNAGAFAALLQSSTLNLKDYVWTEQERPLVAYNQFENDDLIPVIDMGPLVPCLDDALQSPAALSERGVCVAAEMARAGREWGFFQVINHGVSADIMRDMEIQARIFFEALKPEEKRRILRDGSATKPMGYACGGAGTPLKSDLPWIESLHLPSAAEDMEAYAWKVWQDGNKEFRRVVKEFSREMGKVSMRIMEVLMGELLAREEEGVTARTAAGETVEIGGIGQKRRRKGDEEKMDAKVDGRGGGARTEVLVGEQRRNSVVRFNYYPPCPQPSLTLGLGAHSDPHLLTLLHQDLVGGLQICKDGLWMAVRPMPGALVVNIGDALQVWSNDHYKSVEHRAVCNSLRSRLSMGFFLTPMDDATICPLKLSSPHYKPFTWKEYREQMYARRPRGKSNLLHYRIHDQTQ